MDRLLDYLERRVGLVWAYLLLFLITWMLIGVVISFIHVNRVAQSYSELAKVWTEYLPGYLTQQASFLHENISIDAPLEGTKAALGVLVASGKPIRGVLKAIPHDTYMSLNILSTAKEKSAHVVTEVLPEKGISTLFLRVDMSDLSRTALPPPSGDVSWEAGEYSYAFLYTEERYFVLLTKHYRDQPREISYLYNLDTIWVNYIAEQFQRRATYLERESRFGSIILKNTQAHSIHQAELVFDWSEFNIPVRYSAIVPVSLSHLDFFAIIWQTSLITMFLYLLLFFQNRHELKRHRNAIP